MPETSIHVGTGQIGSVSVDPLRFDAAGGPEFPYLNVMVQLALAPVQVRRNTPINQPAQNEQHYTILQASGRLLFHAEGRGLIPIAKFMAGPMQLGTDSGAQAFTIEIELDPYRVRRVEEQRQGNAVFQLDISWLVAKHPEVERGQWNRSIDGLETAFNTLQHIQIPQSHWVTLLPKLGYGKVQIVEIPIPEHIVSEALATSLRELTQAQEDMKQGNYDNVVGHCRNAIQNVADALPPPPQPNGRPASFRQKTDNFLTQMAGLLTDEKRKGVNEIMNAMWQWSSVSQHPHLPGTFNRADAETIMLLTTAMLSYTGRLLTASGTMSQTPRA